MRNRGIAICIGLALVLMCSFVVSAEEDPVEVEMVVLPEMFAISANSPWLELDVHDPALDNYPSFEYLNDSGLADSLGLNETEFYVKITNSNGGEIFNDRAEFDRFEIKRSETTGDFVLGIMVSRDVVELDSDSVDTDLFDGGLLEFEVTGVITYPETADYEKGDVKFKATDSEVKVKLKGVIPANAGGNEGGNKGKPVIASAVGEIPISKAADLNVDGSVEVSMLVSPDTIMLDSHCPLFGIEVEDNADGNLTDFLVYDVQDMNDMEQVGIVLGVIVTEDDGIYDEDGYLVYGEIIIEANNLKEYEISPVTGRLVLQYDRKDVFNFKLGNNSNGEEITVCDLLESACVGDDMTGSVPFYIRGTFEEGIYPAGTEFNGEGNADVMGKSQSEKKGGKNK